MATLTIKNIPDDVYEQLKQRTARHRRSVNRELATVPHYPLQRPVIR
jgi:plasmid stability protein